MQRLLQSDAAGRNPVCQILQNQYANYHFDRRSNAVHIHNYRAWKPDLTVMRLPTDSPDLSDFIAQVEGRPADMELTNTTRNRLLVICNHPSEHGSKIWRIDRHMNVLEEEYFQVSWPERMRVIDNRDAMHKRGWTYFQISGRVGHRSVSGVGRLPFVYAYAHRHHPWLSIRLAGGTRFVDTPTGARLYDQAGLIDAESRGGSFFKGLLRPWMGLHCIDTIRRDAAEQALLFETTVDEDAARAKITVHTGDLTLIYTVDMETDVIETIHFVAEGTTEPRLLGELHFTYLQEIPEETDASFAAPPSIRLGTAPRQPVGILWLERLASQ